MELNAYSAAIATMSMLFSIYYGVIYPQRKKCIVRLCWDEINHRFCILIYNSGKQVLVLDSVELYYKKAMKKISIGKREQLFSNLDGAQNLMPGNSIVYAPTYYSHYDVLGYKGHMDVGERENADRYVYICVTDMSGKKFKAKTEFTLGQVDSRIH